MSFKKKNNFPCKNDLTGLAYRVYTFFNIKFKKNNIFPYKNDFRGLVYRNWAEGTRGLLCLNIMH